MASAWGNSWGSAWGNSWGIVAVEEPRKSRKHTIFYEQALREEEELLMLFRSFIEIIKCHH